MPAYVPVVLLTAIVLAMCAFNYVHVMGKAVAFYALVTASLPVVFNLTKRSPVDRLVGDLSYPLYLLHGAVGAYVAVHYGHAPITMVAISVVLALAALFMIDRPVDVLRQRRIRRAAAASEATVVTSRGWEPTPF